MSTPNQGNGKKSGSTNNSVTNTPSGTPITMISNVVNTHPPIQSGTPPINAPKYGTLVPNRIFVGGISGNTTEAELLQLFSNYGTVKAAKIIQDRAGVSRGYGFVTFESEEDARRLQREADNIVLRERKLNIAPAIKKQPFSRPFDASSPPTIAPTAPAPYFIPAGGMSFYQSGMTYYPQPPTTSDASAQAPPVYQPPTVYPAQSGPPQTAAYPSIVYPTQPLYMPQHFPYHPVPYSFNSNGGPLFMVGNQNVRPSSVHSLQCPASPPRTSYFNAPIPFCNERLYFSVPPFGSSVEASSGQQESLDLAGENTHDLNEDPFGYFGGQLPKELEVHPSIIKKLQTYTMPASMNANSESDTPVVSVLSLDQHQERDYMSLQGGRRRTSTDSLQTVSAQSIPNRYESNCNRGHNGSLSSQSSHRPCDYEGPKHNSYLNNGTFSLGDRSLYHKKRFSKYGDETPSLAEAASFVDENRNENKNAYSTGMAYRYPTRSYNIRNTDLSNSYRTVYPTCPIAASKAFARSFAQSKRPAYSCPNSSPPKKSDEAKAHRTKRDDADEDAAAASLENLFLSEAPSASCYVENLASAPNVQRRRPARRDSSSSNENCSGDATANGASSDYNSPYSMFDNLKL